MRKAVFTFAAALVCSTATAQSSVTLYGLLDTNIEYRTNTNPGWYERLSMNSGGMSNSRWGLRGTEDLGNGLKAVLQLESEISTDTGAGAVALFGRQANVGFEGSFGRVIVGRGFSTTYDFLLPFDPMGYAPQYSWVISGHATAPVSGGPVRKDGMMSSADNLLKYQREFSDFKIGATYSFGEAAGTASQNTRYALGIGYGAGPLNLAAAYDRSNGNTSPYDKATSIHLAVSYEMGLAKLFAGYRNYKNDYAAAAQTDLRSDLYWGGVNYQAAPAWRLTGAIYYQNIKERAVDSDPIMYVAQTRYALSKRTDLYGVAGYAHAKNHQLVGLSRDDAGFAWNQKGVALGVQHRF